MGASPDVKLMAVWQRILRIYREDEVQNRFGSLKMTMFTTRGSPKLKGKAAEVRDLVPVLHKVCGMQSMDAYSSKSEVCFERGMREKLRAQSCQWHDG